MWRLAAQHLGDEGSHTWQHVRAPMGAIIATLLDAGWTPEEWDLWYDTLGVGWKLSERIDAVINIRTCDLLLRSLRRDLQTQLWEHSSSNTFLFHIHVYCC